MNQPGKLTPARMLILGVGWFGVQFFWGFHSGAIPLFLKNFTDSKLMISVVLSLAGVAGCIVPPVAGYLSDRTLGRFGRRSPYIFCGILGASLCVATLPHLSVFAIVTLLAGAMYFSLRVAETPYLSLLSDITPSEQRSTASGVMNLLGTIGLITIFIVCSLVWEKSPTAIFYLVGTVCFATMLITVALIAEPRVPRGGRSGKISLSEYLKGIAEESNVLKLFIAQYFWWLGFWMVSGFVVLFVVEALGVAEKNSFIALLVFSITATLFMVPLGILGDRFGRKGILSVMIAVWAVSEILVGLSRDFTQALILVGITAIPFAAIMGVGLAYMLDLIPKRRTAEFVGFSIISVAVAQIAGPLIGGLLIDTFGYRSIFPAAAGCMLTGLILLQFVKPRPPEEELAEQ